MMTLYVILLIYELYFVIIKDILIFTDLLLLMMNETHREEQRVGVLCQLYLDLWSIWEKTAPWFLSSSFTHHVTIGTHFSWLWYILQQKIFELIWKPIPAVRSADLRLFKLVWMVFRVLFSTNLKHHIGISITHQMRTLCCFVNVSPNMPCLTCASPKL